MLAIVGGTASGKSTLAQALALHRPTAVTLIHLDDFYIPVHEPHRGVRTLSATGAETLDWNDPGSIDEDAAAAALEAAATSGQHRIVVVEGLFALALPKIATQATWRIYVHAPDDIRLAASSCARSRSSTRTHCSPCATTCSAAETATRNTSPPPGIGPISYSTERCRQRTC
ncbi:hypothetical protein ABZ478_33940 [Streptomyces sp. NPDC005706]|uniref:uridine kinase family protein n=1 Tax=Streptomyces sp. NPDC005706 TaxID=3157169 RepID=UPI0033DEBE31